MNVWEAVTWDVARAGGFTAYVLLTLSVAIGLALTMRWQSPQWWPRLINSELHNFITLLALVFTGVHVLAVWVDPFTNFGWNEVFLPFVSHYRPLWMAFGIVALYLGIAVGISTWIRPLIGYTWWRRLHILTLVAYALVTIHGIATGSDTRTWWGAGIYLLSVALVGALLGWRLLVPVNQQGRSHPVIAALIGLATVVGIVWTLLGPLQAGWNAAANNGAGSGASNSLVVPQSQQTSQAQQTHSSQNPFSVPFTASLQGTLTQSGPNSNGAETLQLHSQLSGGMQGILTILLQGQEANNADGNALDINTTQVTLGTNTNASLYHGQLTSLRNERDWRMTALLSGPGTSSLQLRIVAQISDSGQVSGLVQGTPATNSGGQPPLAQPSSSITL